jgi:hypothetical protein
MQDRSEEMRSATSPAPGPAADEGPGGPLLTVLRLALAGLVLAAGMALASPGARQVVPAEQGTCQAPAAPQSVIVLPPGHPPIRGFEPQGRTAMMLPPGHPPIDGPGVRPVPARPLAPLFTAPETVDL